MATSFFQQTEHHKAVVLVQLFQQFGQVGGLLFLGDLAQLDILLFHQHLQQAALGQHLGVGLDFLVPGLLFFGLPDVLLEVLGGFLVQVLGQLLPHLGRDVGGQFLHRKRCLSHSHFLFFHFHFAYLLPCSGGQHQAQNKKRRHRPAEAPPPRAQSRALSPR